MTDTNQTDTPRVPPTDGDPDHCSLRKARYEAARAMAESTREMLKERISR